MKLFNITIPLCFLMVIFFLGCSPYTEGDAIQAGLPTKYAFLIIDIQNDFMNPDGKLPIDKYQSPRILNTINKLLPIFVQKEIEIVYIGNEFDASDTIANWFRNKSAIKGSEGAKLAGGLRIIGNSYFPKKQPDAFSNESFDQYLREKKITNLIISGVFADQCVLSTVKGAANRKYDIYVISDAIGAKTDKDLNKALNKIKSLNVNIVTSDQIISKIGRYAATPWPSPPGRYL